MSDIKGIIPSNYTHNILTDDDFKPVIQPQRRLNLKVQDVVKDEIIKLLDSRLIYPISDSLWIILIHIVPKKGGMPVVLNDNNELIPSLTVIRWRACIDYHKLNDATRNDHFLLPFIDKMLKRLCGNKYYCFLDGFSGFFQILLAPEYQEKTTFTCPYRTFAYRRMPFGLYNPPATFQRCMMVIFHDMVEDFIEVFMDDFSVFGNSFNSCLANLDRMLARCKETNLVLNWEKCYLMVKEGIFLGHKSSGEDYLSRLENPDLGTFKEDEIMDEFFNEHLIILKAKLSDDEPWLCPNNVMRRCVAGNKILKILAHYHSRPTGGHHSASITGRKVYESGFFWPSIFKDAKDYVMRCEVCQRSGNTSSRNEMPQNNIHIYVMCLTYGG
uniref:Putative reverse transcriptase domain-containing protein n=1 Tax=Tanacetum cinerariifolium TaxID=118510 RepID=A0A6L2MEH6_TANCI|nr:putative reverse transcriptase domain-containing protein [Tanacetum cinerariifolium]